MNKKPKSLFDNTFTNFLNPQMNDYFDETTIYKCCFHLVCVHVYPLNANRLSDVELPLPLEGVQVPELSRVRGRADGVAT